MGLSYAQGGAFEGENMIKEYMLPAPVHTPAGSQWDELWKQRQNIDCYAHVVKSDELRAIRSYIANLRPGSTILDAGCGLGQWVFYLNNKGHSVAGLDIGKNIIENLQTQFPSINFRCEDIRKTSFPDNHFDAYISWGVIEHFENGPAECIKEAHRLLKPGGLLLVSVPFHNVRLLLRQWLTGVDELTPSPGCEKVFYQYRFKKHELADALKQGNFEVEKIVPIHKYHGFLRFLNTCCRIDVEKAGELIRKKLHSNILRKAFLLPFYIAGSIMPACLFSHMILAVGRKK